MGLSTFSHINCNTCYVCSFHVVYIIKILSSAKRLRVARARALAHAIAPTTFICPKVNLCCMFYSCKTNILQAQAPVRASIHYNIGGGLERKSKTLNLSDNNPFLYATTFCNMLSPTKNITDANSIGAIC